MKKIKFLILTVFAITLFVSCEEENTPVQANYVAFEGDSFRLGVDPGSSSNQAVTVYTANVTNSDRSIDLTVNTSSSTAPTGSYNVPASVVIPAGTNEATFNVEVSGVSGLDCFNTVVVDFAPTDGLSDGGSTTVTFFENPVATTGGATSNIRILIAPDSYPEETSWQITDILGNVVETGGPYPGISGTNAFDFTLPANSCYTLTFFDSYGDGMASGSGFALEVDGVRVVPFVVRTDWSTSVSFDFSTK